MSRAIDLHRNREAFDALFTKVRRSWFRLETLQRYDDDAERAEFAAFLRGEPVDLTPGPWQAMIHTHVAAGRRLTRVHVIEEPHTDYIRYELAGYPVNVDAGEDVRVIPVTRGAWPSDVPRHDYWLFDDTDLWLMDYDDQGVLHRVKQVDDTDAVEQHRQWRDNAVAHSVPLSEYVAAALRHAS